MKDTYREAGNMECPAYDWDVVWHFGMPKVHFRSAEGTWRLSSDIVDEQGFSLRDGSVFADAKDGTKIRVLSGKTYVLRGERKPYPNHPQLSMLHVPEPETRSWMARLFHR